MFLSRPGKLECVLRGTLFSKLSQVVSSGREETQHEIHVVNDTVDRLNERMNEELRSHTAEAKQNCTNLSEELDAKTKAISVELGEHKTEIENCLGNFRREISNFRQEIVTGNSSVSSGTEENLSKLQERIEAAERKSNSRLGEFTSKLDRLQH
jgi:exonuclease VII large subunit